MAVKTLSTNKYSQQRLNSTNIVPVSAYVVTITPAPSSIDYLVVAGGGGGGQYNAGGGGAGGLLTNTGTTIDSTTTYVVTIGGGGVGGAGGSGGSGVAGSNGINSSLTGTSITPIIAVGGGGGGAYSAAPATSGGSGGGGGTWAGLAAGGSGTAGPPRQGYDGGGLTGASNSPPYAGSGGGGAGAPGVSGNPGAGGAGTYTSFISTTLATSAAVGQVSSSTVYFAGGGGGGGNSAFAVGGIGGGGSGSLTTGAPGTAFTGGGGGAGGGTNSGPGGQGGSGVVIIRHLTSYATAVTTGNPTVGAVSGNTVYIFTASGTIKFLASSSSNIPPAPTWPISIVSGTAVNTQLTSTGTSVLTYTLLAGNSLPAGVTLSTSGLLSGTASVGTYTFSVSATDAVAQSVTQLITLNVSVNPITGMSISSLYVTDNSYTALTPTRTAVSTSGGYVSIIGTGFAPTNKVYIQGIPATTSTYVSGTQINAQLPAYNTSTQNAQQIYVVNTLTNSAGILITGFLYSIMPYWTISSSQTLNGPAISASLAALSDSSLVYSLYSGTLPAGLTLNTSTGLISGTVSDATSTNIVILATDAETQTNTQTFTISIIVGDTNIMYNTLLLNGETTAKPFNADASTSSFEVAVFGDTRPNNFNPYTPGYYSNFFPGGGSRLAVSKDCMQLGTGDFTVECWVNMSSLANGNVFTRNWSGANFFILGVSATGQVGIWLGHPNGGWINPTSTATPIKVGKWHHLAITRSGTSVKVFADGVEIITASSSVNLTSSDTTPVYIGWYFGDSTGMTGYISNLRVVAGTAVYTSAFTPPTGVLTAMTGTLLLTCQSPRFVDNSTNAFVLTDTASPQVQSTNPFTPNSSYSTYGSGYFDGTGDYLSATGTALNLVSGDFTVEAWIYIPAGSTYQFIIGSSDNAAGYMMIGLNVSLSPTSTIAIGRSGINWPVQFGAGITFTSNTWTHVAITRSGTTNRAFINGVQLGSNVTDSTSWSFPSNTMWIGNQTGGTAFNGYMTDVRVVKGTAVYTATFTPPTAPLTAITNTSLLTCQTNQSVNTSQFLDMSSNSLLITRNGNANMGTFAPFGANWSNYFNGNADFLQLSNNSAFLFGSGNFTLECWLFSNTITSGDQVLMSIWDDSSTVPQAWDFRVNGSGKVFFQIDVATADTTIFTSVATLSAGQWYHLAVTRSGNTFRLFINGTLDSTTTNSSTISNGNGPLCVGGYTGSNQTDKESVNGYLSNVRIVKGTAVYTGNFTPSTTPLTAITNTSLLTCQSPSFVDNGPNAFAITATGTPKVQRFSPFANYLQTPTTYSTKFNGSSDYLSLTDSSNLMDLGGATASLEFWVYTTSANSCLVTKGGTAASYSTTNGIEYTLALISSQFTWYYNNGGANGTLTDSITRSLNTWYHVVFASNATILSLFVDGTRTATATAGIVKPTTRTSVRIGLDWGTAYYSGYFSNIRFIQGTGAYDASLTTLTVPTAPLTAVANTSLLTLQDATIKDNSTNAFTLTPTGSPTPKTFNPFGYTTSSKQSYTPAVYGGSAYFDGTGDYLNFGNQNALHLGSGSYTVEMWIWKNTNASYMTVCGDLQVVPSNTWQIIGDVGGTKIGWYDGVSNAFTITSNASIPLNTWTHIAFVRSSTTLTLYINGVSDSSNTLSSNYNATTSFFIGHTPELIAGRYWNGYISNFRMVKGTALYISNFVPPAAPVTSTPATVLLLGNSPAIADYSMQNNLETVGDAKISTAVKKYNNASLYFDGTGDYLSSSDNLTLAFGSGAFTVEGWIYLTNTSGTKGIMFGRGSNSFGLRIGQGYLGNVNGLNIAKSGIADLDYCAFTFATNTWYHIAVVRSSTTIYFFVNGTQQTTQGSGAGSFSFVNPTSGFYIGCNNDTNEQFAGYIDDFRITKGVARYTANFTAPTSALIAQ